MRTGTSLVSKQLHELGVPMGTTMRFPLARENTQLDWEDIEFTDKCLATLKGTSVRGARLKIFFNQYIRRRGTGLWGVKSPFLSPYIEMFKEEANHLGHKVKVILTTRDTDDTFDSIRRQTDSQEPIKTQYELLTYVPPAPDLIIPIEDSWKTPELVKDKLSKLIKEF